MSRFLVDENVSYELVGKLRSLGAEVISVVEEKLHRTPDTKIFSLAVDRNAVIITRDYHFTNPLSFPVGETEGIIYIRHGNITSDDEVKMVTEFIKRIDIKTIKGKLVTLYKNSVRMR